jgi:probable addiction module antidote protein
LHSPHLPSDHKTRKTLVRGLPRVRASNESDPTIVEAAEVDIARAKGIAQIGLDAGLGRESLCKALSAEGNSDFAAIMRVVSALRLKLLATHVRPTFISLQLFCTYNNLC